MFGIKKFKQWVIEQLNKLICEINGRAKREDVIFKNDYVECSRCGVLVRNDKAKKVQTLASKMEIFPSLAGFDLELPTGEKEIKTDYYCQLHSKTKK